MSRWNPSKLKDNCGYCAISYALEQKGIILDADGLYNQLMDDFDIDRRTRATPVPRTLIFPKQIDLDKTPWPPNYEELQAKGHTPSDYTIRSVALHFKLHLSGEDKQVVNSLVEYAADFAKAGWKRDDFVRYRLQRLGKANSASEKDKIEKSLKGNFILGSTDAKHYVNMSFSPTGEWRVFDPQDGVLYEPHHVKVKLGIIALFDRAT